MFPLRPSNGHFLGSAQGFVQRLGVTADQLGLGFGVKFSNTLIVENHRSFFPESEKEMYHWDLLACAGN